MKQLGWLALVLPLLLSACAGHSVGVSRVSTQQAYQQVEANVLLSGGFSSDTRAVLHRLNLAELAETNPANALLALHDRALLGFDRDFLFALAELSYWAAERSSAREANSFYLGAAAYAYLFLFGEGDDLPAPFDRRFRFACDLYNYGLGRALVDASTSKPVIRLEDGRRSLPLGKLDILVKSPEPDLNLDQFSEFLLADEYKVRGLSVRNRTPGLGAPLIAVGHIEQSLRSKRCSPVTAFLRLRAANLRQLGSDEASATLEIYSGYSSNQLSVAGQSVPMEKDLTIARAYTLNGSFGRLTRLNFFLPGAGLPGQVILTEPYEPGRIPIVLVHGTYSSPVAWGEMLNTLYGDPMIRKKYQIWLFLYSSSKPMVFSGEELREMLTKTVHDLDPEGQDKALHEMVIIGHSQGGLLAKMACTDSGDKLWRVFSQDSFSESASDDETQQVVERYLFLKPLPFVRRVVFIATPHRGSYRIGGPLRRIVRRLVSVPRNVTQTTINVLHGTKGVIVPEMFRKSKLTSVDGMSPRNPLLLTLAEIPVAPAVKAHSIIAIRHFDGAPRGGDGIVRYESAHVDYVESELIVQGRHSCQSLPATIEEVRRILYLHLSEDADFEGGKARSASITAH